MKNTQNPIHTTQVLHILSALPEKILRLHGSENVSEFVLCQLCHPSCFNIPKAAFFIDNPDFNCFKGVAGYHEKEYPQHLSLWDQPDAFTEFMSASPFNKEVRSVSLPSFHNDDRKEQQFINDMAHQLDVRDLRYHRFALKNGNHGLMLYDLHAHQPLDHEIVARGACYLGFCPVF